MSEVLPAPPPEDDEPTHALVEGETGVSPRPEPSTDPARSVFRTGEVVASRFRIVRFLAKGGMGELYEAEDTELHERVALKTILSKIADERSIQMFKREVHLARQVTHPNVCRIFDVFRHQPRRAAGTEGEEPEVIVLAMELLNGETLADKLQRDGRLTTEEALPLARQMAAGLTAAHRAGVVHRDFKSLNVMLVKPISPDGELRAVITDFGLAKRNSEDARSSLSVSLNDAGVISGTPAYMAPEQVEGGAVTPATDVYAMGVVLFEMVAGARPFVADTPLKTAVKRLQEPAPSPRIHLPDLDERWEAAILRCLARQPADRFATADEAVAALSDASSSVSRPTGFAISRSRDWKILVGAVAVVALGVAAIAFLRWPLKFGGAAGAVKRVAVLPFENQGPAEDDYFADGIADEIRGKLTSLKGLLVLARGSSTPYKKTTKTPKQIAEELKATYLLNATVRWDKSGGKSRVHVSPELVDVTDPGSPALKWQQPFDATMTDVFQVQSDIATRAAQALGMVLGAGDEKRLSEKPTQNLAAYDAFLKGEETSNAMAANDPPRVRKALVSYEQAVALDPAFAQAWARISLANSTLFANAAPTPALAEHARQAAEKAVALAPDRPEPYLASGFYERFVRHDSARALEQFGKGLSVAPGNADLLTGSARAEQALGLWEAAVAHFKEAERSDPRSAITLRRLGTALLLLRRYPEAREALDRGLAIAPTDLSTIENKAMTFLGEGNLAGAREVLHAPPQGVEPEALLVYVANYFGLVWVLDDQQREILLRQTPSAFDDDRGNWGSTLVDADVLKGDSAAIRTHAEEARKAYDEQVRAAPQEPGGHVSLGLALAYLGRKEEAIQEGERGVALSPISKDAVSSPYYQHQLVRIYIVVGDPDKALDRLEPLLKVPYLLSPGWLKIDPNFAPLRGNRRFQKLVAGAR